MAARSGEHEDGRLGSLGIGALGVPARDQWVRSWKDITGFGYTRVGISQSHGVHADCSYWN